MSAKCAFLSRGKIESGVSDFELLCQFFSSSISEGNFVTLMLVMKHKYKIRKIKVS